MNSRYPIKQSRHSSHQQICDLIKKFSETLSTNERTILDVGCSRGEIGKTLKNDGFNYSGIEPNVEDVLLAQASGLEVIQGSAENLPGIVSGHFQFVIFADVLEHLAQPEEVLVKAKEILMPSSYVLISIPNVANFVIRVKLLLGQWNYTDRGIMDRTHLKFYTKKSIVKLCHDSGFEIVALRQTPLPFEVVLPKLGIRIINLLESIYSIFLRLSSSLFAYQFIVIVKQVVR